MTKHLCMGTCAYCSVLPNGFVLSVYNNKKIVSVSHSNRQNNASAQVHASIKESQEMPTKET